MLTKKLTSSKLTVLVFVLFTAGTNCFAANNTETTANVNQNLPMSQEAHKDSDKPTIQNDRFLELGEITSASLLLQAQAALRENHFDQAIKFAKRGLAKDNDDIDLHKFYAQALEMKLSQQGTNPEVSLFNECVQEWLVVLRNQVGEEKGLSCHGISLLPFAQQCYQDEDRSILARYHLIALTGSAPKPWETNIKYLNRVLKPIPSVHGKIIKTSQ